MEIIDVIRKLVGPIDPVGETQTDNARYENLKTMIEVVSMLLVDIEDVAAARTRKEFSMCRAGKLAHAFLAAASVNETPSE